MSDTRRKGQGDGKWLRGCHDGEDPVRGDVLLPVWSQTRTLGLDAAAVAEAPAQDEDDPLAPTNIVGSIVARLGHVSHDGGPRA